MSYIKIWIHAVWTTKNRVPYLKKKMRYKVFKHIKEYADSKGIYVDFINGHIDHVHCLISLNSNQCIADVMYIIKGESSFWINKMELTESKFGWQNKYYAASVSQSHVERVRNYIRNQEVHHRKTSLDEEIEEFFPDQKPRVEARGN
ncbi:MAG: IS200/IS605 family transposase [Bacteroidetes bacterium]|nr:MAG: IS200/IS605 family transposase [Bacteroidota bacterium]